MPEETRPSELDRPIGDLLRLTPGLRKALADRGVRTLGELLSLDLRDEILRPGDQRTLVEIREQVTARLERIRNDQIASTPLPQSDDGDRPSLATQPGKAPTPISPVESPSTGSDRSLPGVADAAGFRAGYLWARTSPFEEPRLDSQLVLQWDDLLRHVFICGGTGSGKTVLAKGLLEQAAASGIPSLVIDPAGDLGFLALRPTWSEDEQAAIACTTTLVEDYPISPDAKATFDFWSKEVATHRRLCSEGGVTRNDAQLVHANSFVRLFGPQTERYGCQLALPPFAPDLFGGLPGEDVAEFDNRLDELAHGVIRALGITPEPRASRLSTVLKALLRIRSPRDWHTDREPLSELLPLLGQLAALVPSIRQMPLDTFLERGDVREMQRAIIQYLEGPSAAWLRGQQLDVAGLFASDSEQAPINVVHIGHLEPEKQQYAVARLVSAIDRWMRTAPPTRSGLRAIVCIDELGGGGGRAALFPPSATPISKPPLLRLIRQARKYGVGIVLATQNVKDIDYKGLGNIATWFVGKLTTPLDQKYVTDGVAQAAHGQTSIDRGALSKILPGLRPATFIHVSGVSSASRFKARYISSIHTQPRESFYECWHRVYSRDAGKAATKFIEGQGEGVLPRRYAGAVAFAEALLAGVSASVGDDARTCAAFQCLLGSSSALVERSRGVLFASLERWGPDVALRRLTRLSDCVGVREDVRIAITSRVVALNAERVGVAQARAVCTGLPSQLRALWTRFLDAVALWRIPSHDVTRWAVATSSGVVRVVNWELQATVEKPAVARVALATDTTMREYVRGLPREVLLEWYREQARSVEEAKYRSGETELPESSRLISNVVGGERRGMGSLKLAERLTEAVSAMTPSEFEEFVASVLRRQGYQTELTAASGDGGIDILATRNSKRLAVQCKRYSQAVGPEIIREIEGARTLHACDKALVVASGRFSPGACSTAEKLGVALMDGDDMTQVLWTLGESNGAH